jgi:hypothetical protein
MRRAPYGAFTVLHQALGLSDPDVRTLAEGGRVALRRVVAPDLAPHEERPRPEPPPTRAAPAPRVVAPVASDAMAGRRLSFSALSTLATCPRRFHLEYERGLRGRPDAIVAALGAGTPASAWGGTAAGDLVHRALAALDWAGPAPAAGWSAAAAASLGLPDSPADGQRVERMVCDLLASDVTWRVRGGVARHAELPFATVVDGVLLSGAIDMIVDEGDGRALLLDWKTHSLAGGRSAADVAEEYDVQQALYALVALRAGWTEVTLRWVVLEDIAGSPSRVVRAEDAPALEARVRAALAALRGPDRTPAALTPQVFCSGCPGLDAMCPVAVATRA